MWILIVYSSCTIHWNLWDCNQFRNFLHKNMLISRHKITVDHFSTHQNIVYFIVWFLLSCVEQIYTRNATISFVMIHITSRCVFLYQITRPHIQLGNTTQCRREGQSHSQRNCTFFCSERHFTRPTGPSWSQTTSRGLVWKGLL